jgi:hypothetical protein
MNAAYGPGDVEHQVTILASLPQPAGIYTSRHTGPSKTLSQPPLPLTGYLGAPSHLHNWMIRAQASGGARLDVLGPCKADEPWGNVTTLFIVDIHLPFELRITI